MLIAMTGATGYVGSRVVPRLLRREHAVRALARRPDRSGSLADLGVEPVAGDLADAEALRALVQGADAVVHLAAVIAERGGATFEAVHVRGTEALLAAARDARTPLVVHMSTLGARDAPGASRFQRSRWRGEEAVRASGIPHAILRPSVIAGRGNPALQKMVDMIRLLPVVPVIGDGRYQMQPIWIEDVAEIIALVLERGDLRGSFDLGGPGRLTYHEMLDRLEAALGVRRPRVAVPVVAARLAALAGTALPDLAPITVDQLQMLLEGSVVDANAAESRFGLAPRPFAEVAQEICAPWSARPAAP